MTEEAPQVPYKDILESSDKQELRKMIEKLQEEGTVKKRKNDKEKQCDKLVADYQDRWHGKAGDARLEIQLATEGKERKLDVNGKVCDVQARVWLTSKSGAEEPFAFLLELVKDEDGEEFWALETTTDEPRYEEHEDTRYWKFGEPSPVDDAHYRMVTTIIQQ